MGESRVIKRYANRKMYDTARSCYVTLEEVADMVREGCDVQVIDNKTKNDLTEVTLTQALLDSERRNRGTVPLSGLRTLISHGNQFLHRRIAEPVSRVRTDAERTVTAWKDEAERTVTAWKSEAERLKVEAERRAERVLHRKPPHPDDVLDEAAVAPEATGPEPALAEPTAAPQPGAPGGPKLAVLVEHTQKAYDELQQRFDERIRHAVAALGLPLREEQEAVELRRRIEDLEARIAALEAQREPPPGTAS